MDRKYIDDHHVVARYLADRLAEDERQAFEAYYLEHPQILQEMEAAARLQVGLRQLQERGELDQLLRAKPDYRRQRRWAVAAGVAIAVVGLLFWAGRGPAHAPILVASSAGLVDRLGRPLPIASTLTVLRTRGSSYDAEITLPDRPRTIVLRILPEVAAQPARYRVTLSRMAGDDSLRQVAVIGNLPADADGLVPVYLNSLRLEHGRYQLALSGDAGTSAADATSTFLVQIIDDSPP